MSHEPCWFRYAGHAFSETVWYWDGAQGWSTSIRNRRLLRSYFDPAKLLAIGYVRIPDPFDLDLALPEGL